MTLMLICYRSINTSVCVGGSSCADSIHHYCSRSPDGNLHYCTQIWQEVAVLMQIKISRCLSSWSSVCRSFGPWSLSLSSLVLMSTVLRLLGPPIPQVLGPWVPGRSILIDSCSSDSHPVLWFSGLGSLHPRFPCLGSLHPRFPCLGSLHPRFPCLCFTDPPQRRKGGAWWL